MGGLRGAGEKEQETAAAPSSAGVLGEARANGVRAASPLRSWLPASPLVPSTLVCNLTNVCLSWRSLPLLFTLVHGPSTRASCTHWQDTGRWAGRVFLAGERLGPQRAGPAVGTPSPAFAFAMEESGVGARTQPRAPLCQASTLQQVRGSEELSESSAGWQTQPQPGTLSFASRGLRRARSPREEPGVPGTPLSLPFPESSEASASCLSRGADGRPS